MSIRHRRGFTLIELLVVVAIIAVLVSLLIPSVIGARFAAERANCLSRIRGITMAMSMYVNESNDWFPPVPLNGAGNPQYDYGGWSYRIVTYMGYPQVAAADYLSKYRNDEYPAMACPSFVTGTQTAGYPHWRFGLSFGLQNHRYLPTGEVNPDLSVVAKPLRPYETPKASEIMMFVDNGMYATTIHPVATNTYGVEGHPSGVTGSPNHEGRGNSMSYIDGHAIFQATLQPYVMDPDARWAYASAWPVWSWGYHVAKGFPVP